MAVLKGVEGLGRQAVGRGALGGAAAEAEALGGQPGVHEHGDRGGAEHGADLAGGVVDAGARAGLAPSAGCGWRWRPAAPRCRTCRCRGRPSAAGAARARVSGSITRREPQQRDGGDGEADAVSSRGWTRSVSRPTIGAITIDTSAIGTSSSADWVGEQPAHQLGVEHEREADRGGRERPRGDRDVGDREVAVLEQPQRHQRLVGVAGLPEHEQTSTTRPVMISPHTVIGPAMVPQSYGRPPGCRTPAGTCRSR